MTDESKDCRSYDDGRITERDEAFKKTLITRLNRVEGQVRGIRGMVEKDAYCDNILAQITAARAALDAISKVLLESHIHGCLLDRIRSGDDTIVDELMVTIGRMLK